MQRSEKDMRDDLEKTEEKLEYIKGLQTEAAMKREIENLSTRIICLKGNITRVIELKRQLRLCTCNFKELLHEVDFDE